MSFAEELLAAWHALGDSEEGRTAFAEQLATQVPYTGTIAPRVLELSPGHALVAMDDRPAVRNHLDCIHAVALVNLGEAASGLALLAGLPRDARAILVGLSIEYHKKARGTLLARCDCTPPGSDAETRLQIAATIRDDQGEEVAGVSAHWAVGPTES